VRSSDPFDFHSFLLFLLIFLFLNGGFLQLPRRYCFGVEVSAGCFPLGFNLRLKTFWRFLGSVLGCYSILVTFFVASFFHHFA